MTNTKFKNNPTPRQAFTVVPPQTPKPSPPVATPQLRPNSSPQKPQNSPIVKPQEETETFPQKTPLRGLVTVGAIALAVGTIGFIPIPNYVTGQTEITSRTNARQLLTMPVSGRVKIYVHTNQHIQPNQLIAEIQSDELDNQLTEAERELERAKLGVNSAQQQLIISQARLNAAQNNEAIARNRTNRQLTEVSNNTSHPQIQRLEREKEISRWD